MENSSVFRIDRVINQDGKYSYHITWPNIPIAKKAYYMMVKWARDSRDYSVMNHDTLSKTRLEIASQCKCPITVDQIRSIRSAVVKEKIMFGYKRMNELMEDISAKYSNNGILELAVKYDFPPLNLLRGIFLHRNIDKKIVHKLFSEKLPVSNESEMLSDRDLKQYKLAAENDAESTFNQQLVDKIAAENENVVVNYFKSLGIGVVTQEQLVKEQMEEHGRAILTPDILFTDDVYINGAKITWIDYKDYAGTLIKFLRTSNIAQAQKYYNKWGQGALCFHQSFIEDMVIPGAMLLDARTLPVKLKLFPQIYSNNGSRGQKKKGEKNKSIIDG